MKQSMQKEIPRLYVDIKQKVQSVVALFHYIATEMWTSQHKVKG